MARESVDAVLSLAEASIAIGVSPFTLRAWLAKGDGPAHLRVGRQIKFRQTDVERWLQARAVPKVAGA